MRIKRPADAEPEPTRHTNITIKNKSLEEIQKSYRLRPWITRKPRTAQLLLPLFQKPE